MRDGGETELAYRCRAGRPVPLGDMRIVDAEMRDLPHDGIATGEVVMRSPWLTQGYLENPEAAATLWHGGWLHTGDIGSHRRTRFPAHNRPDQGRGENRRRMGVQPAAGRHYLRRTSQLSEVAVIGVKDARWGERPVAVIVTKPGDQNDAGALRALVMASVEEGVISKYAVPERVEFVESIARTSVGKLDKKVLRAEFS